MKAKSIIYLIGISLFGVFPGCTSEFEQPDSFQEVEVTEVDINLSFESDWSIDIDETRAAPPGTGGNNDNDLKVDGYDDLEEVDKVRVIAFKKREDTDGHFIYDIRNDQILNIEEEKVASDGKPAGHKHKIAHGKLKKTYGFEYRVIAIAYASKKTNLYNDINRSDNCKFFMPNGEQNWFTINTDSEPIYDDVMALLNFKSIEDNVKSDGWRDFIKYNGNSYFAGDLTDSKAFDCNVNPLSRNVVQVPQIFYGILHSQSGSEIIGYSETEEDGDMVTDLPVSGILYRGVAKLTINLKIGNNASKCQWIALMADEVTTKVSLSSYDGFLIPTKEGLNTGYTAVNYMKLGNKTEEVMTTWFLPTRTKLALRIKDKGDGINSIKNFQINTNGSIYSSGNGTGIISPDVSDDVFYLRRNHTYTILEIDVDRLMNNNDFNDKN